MKIIAFANTVHTNTLTGGDRIFAECAKRWRAGGHDVRIVTNEIGKTFCIGLDVPVSIIDVWRASFSDRFGVYIAMSVKAVLSTIRAIPYSFRKIDVAFATSFFLPDLLPAFFLKLTNKKAVFAAACYLFSTQPWGADYSGGRLKGFLFYLNEQIAFYLLKRFDGIVFTASAFDRREFIKTQRFPARRVLAIRGGVDTAFFRSASTQEIRYDAVFVGRFHPQKCIDELIDIWRMVVRKDPSRVLALVGAGSEEEKLRMLVFEKHLKRNILFLGSADGTEKTKILKSSRIFVSASRYDSGNIALDEALGCGIPGIVYDLVRLDYPKGVLKVPEGNTKAFARAIQSLLKNDSKRSKLAEEAYEFSLSLDWEAKANELLWFMQKFRQR
jgi:glycosyltransferase involved in cell wall biosynthesis